MPCLTGPDLLTFSFFSNDTVQFVGTEFVSSCRFDMPIHSTSCHRPRRPISVFDRPLILPGTRVLLRPPHETTPRSGTAPVLASPLSPPDSLFLPRPFPFSRTLPSKDIAPMSSTIVSQPPRFISQHHRSPPSSAHSPPPVLQGQSRSPPPPPSASSRPLAPPPKSSQAAASKPVPAHAPPQAVIAGVPVSNEYVPVQMSAEEERRRRDEVFKAEKWSVLASQHHRSEYNRLKWGDKGQSTLPC